MAAHPSWWKTWGWGGDRREPHVAPLTAQHGAGATAVAPASAETFMRPSYSQLGEDGTLEWLFADQRDGFYVDVGCFHPFKYSNTAVLHIHHGWSGINIDLDERTIAAFNEARPNDINVLAAVGFESGDVEAIVFTEASMLNSLHRDLPADVYKLPHVKRMVTVKTLADVLSQHMPLGRSIDFLNIDAEGLDYDILKSNDWRIHKPRVVAVETQVTNVAHVFDQPSYGLLTQNGYELLSHTVVTSIFRLP